MNGERLQGDMARKVAQQRMRGCPDKDGGIDSATQRIEVEHWKTQLTLGR
jgi:hypothetical protein